MTDPDWLPIYEETVGVWRTGRHHWRDEPPTEEVPTVTRTAEPSAPPTGAERR